jgi:hypothetical protein
MAGHQAADADVIWNVGTVAIEDVLRSVTLSVHILDVKERA